MNGLICVAGGKGAPGASTVAFALAVAVAEDPDLSVTLVEADPDGGALAARLAIPCTPGLVSLAAAARHGLQLDLIGRHSQPLTPSVDLVVAPASPEQTISALVGLGRPFAESLASTVAVADVGRWRQRSPAADLVRESATTLLVIRPTLEGVAHARSQLDDLRRLCGNVVVACLGDRPYGADEVADTLDVEAVATVPVDRRGAALVGAGCASDRWLSRSPLMRSARGLSAALRASEVVAS